MAFYSVRVDEQGKEIETTRQTFRKLYLEPVDNGNARPTQQQENTPAPAPSQPGGANYKTVRYVNSATFIEKDSRKSQLAEEEVEEEEEEEVCDDDALNSDGFGGYNSDDLNGQQYQTHMASMCDTVPLLELNSNESFPSSNTMTYSYRKVCEVTKMIQKPDAYKEWLDAKKTAKNYEHKLQLEKEKREEEKKKERKMLAEKKFQEWMARKSKTKVEGEKQKKQEPENVFDSTEDCSNHMEPITTAKSSEEERLEKEKNFRAWLKKKTHQEKSVKHKLNEELKREKELDQKRREQAAEIYDDWLKSAPQKPKPVPLNRGMLTLKGSVSEIYVNPVAWVTHKDSTTSMF